MATKYFVVVNVLKYVLRLAAYLLYCGCWLCACALNCVINGWILTLKLNELTSNTAELGRILWKQKFSILSETSPYDFLCIFRTRVNPEYVLRPTVSLYAITKNEAIFVETPEEVNIYSSDVHPFFLAAQFLHATKVIKMTIRDFVNLAEKIGDPTVPVIWISNTGRCGGTLLCQVFESVPGTLAIQEPDPPTNVHYLNEGNTIEDSEFGIMLKSMIRVMCKPRPGITRICIKPRPQCTVMMRDIGELGLDVRQVFIYRNSMDTLRSWLALMSHDPYLVVLRLSGDAVWFSNILPCLRNKLKYYFMHKMKNTLDLATDATTSHVFTYSWANQILIARDAMSRDQYIVSVKYEDILSQSTKVVKQLFERSGVDTRHIERAVTGLSRDSQRGSGVSHAKIGDASHRSISETDRIKCDAILSQFNLPRLGEDFRLETSFDKWQ